MARIRTIKPDFFTSDDIVSLSPLARLLYVALWCEADREGRLIWRPRTFKLRYLPADDCDIEALARELVESGLIRLYGVGLAYIPKFSRHQNINPRESASVLPAPSEEQEMARVPHASARVSDATVTHSEEGKGKERYITRQIDAPVSRSKKVKAVTLPPGFGISDRVRAWAAEKGHGDLEARLEHFVSYARRSGKTYADWDEAFMTAIRDDWAKIGRPEGKHWATQGLVL